MNGKILNAGLSNYSYINADDLICSGFTVDETDEHYILKVSIFLMS